MDHVFITPETCGLCRAHPEEENCPVCDWGLSFCSICGKGEGELQPQCPGRSQAQPSTPSRKDNDMSIWKMKPPTSSGNGDWELPPAGNMAAVCVALIDLGTQQDAFQGKPREVHQLAIVWELVGMNSSKNGRPHVVCQKFNASLHPKSNFRKTLESWRGMPIKDDEEFDIFKIVGAPCLLQVSHDTTSSGNEIYSIDAATAVPKGMSRPVATYPLVKYKIDEGPQAIPTQDWLPMLYGKKIPDIVNACVEFRGRGAATAGSPGQQPQQGGAPLNPAPSQDADQIPF